MASGSERRYTTSRTPASNGSPASASDPPMTMTLGFSRLTALANTSPMLRPAALSNWVASTDPPRTSVTTSWLEWASMPRGPQLAGNRGAAGDGLQAAHVAAPTDGVDVVGNLDVAEVAGGTLRAATQRTVADDPAADPGCDLDEHQVVDVAVAGEVLTERHDVHVVVDHDDAVEL